MIKLKDVVWGEVDLVDEDLVADESNADTNGQGRTVLMCCGGAGAVPIIWYNCPNPTHSGN